MCQSEYKEDGEKKILKSRLSSGVYFFFCWRFLVLPFSLHYYADAPLEVSVESCLRTQMLCPTSLFYTESPIGFEYIKPETSLEAEMTN